MLGAKSVFYNWMQDIKDYDVFTKIEPVNKGWSNDQK
jgi:hypothetical protein